MEEIRRNQEEGKRRKEAERIALLHPRDNPRLHSRDRRNLVKSLDRRQTDPIFELDATFVPISKLIFRKKFASTYGVSLIGKGPVDWIIGEIDNHSASAGLKLRDYWDFMQAFFPIIHQSTKEVPVAGYKPSELGEIFDSDWWKGNMDRVTFNDFLKTNPNTAYVRRSEGDRSAFVIGFDRGDPIGTQLTKFRQENNRIVVATSSGETTFYRSIRNLYEKFAKESFVQEAGSSKIFWPHFWNKGRGVGASLPAIDFEAHREISAAEEECDWSRWM